VAKLESQKLREVGIVESGPLADAKTIALILHNRPQSSGNIAQAAHSLLGPNTVIKGFIDEPTEESENCFRAFRRRNGVCEVSR
jgi:hypothetical protein